MPIPLQSAGHKIIWVEGEEFYLIKIKNCHQGVVCVCVWTPVSQFFFKRVSFAIRYSMDTLKGN